MRWLPLPQPPARIVRTVYAIDGFFNAARSVGMDRERAQAILDDEMGKAESSLVRTSDDALAAARRRLVTP